METLVSNAKVEMFRPRANTYEESNSKNINAITSKRKQETSDWQCCWNWDSESMSSCVSLCSDGDVLFHPDYSCGTAAIRGNQPFQLGAQHYWEIKLTSALYGTDMMIGIGSGSVDLNAYRTVFSSLLGLDAESWGLSYLGTIQHNGGMKPFTQKLERGDVIGFHLDMWQGTLAIYNNGRYCGIAFHGLQNKELYPMISSTAARTRMKLLKSCHVPTNLQYMCCETIGSCLSRLQDLQHLPIPPGLKRYINNHMAWVIRCKSCKKDK